MSRKLACQTILQTVSNSPEIKKFKSLEKFKELGFIVFIEDDVVFLYRDVKEYILQSIHFSICSNSQKTYSNGFGLTRDELELINLFWKEYDELMKARTTNYA